MGLTSLESLDEIVEVNRRNYEQYRSELGTVPGLSVLAYDPAERNNYQYLVVEVDEALTGISRDDLVRVLNAENVVARRYFWPGCHRMEPYRSLYPHWRFLLPVTEAVAARVIVLPTGTGVSAEEIGEVCAILRRVVASGAEVSARLAQLG
jgi:dTDP-4-amino-4,6-dideoxygalactose transaminase